MDFLWHRRGASLSQGENNWPSAVGDGSTLPGEELLVEGEDPRETVAAIHANAKLSAMATRTMQIASRDATRALGDIVKQIVGDYWKNITQHEAVAIAFQCLDLADCQVDEGRVLGEHVKRVKGYLADMTSPLLRLGLREEYKYMVLPSTCAMTQAAIFISLQERVQRERIRRASRSNLSAFLFTAKIDEQHPDPVAHLPDDDLASLATLETQLKRDRRSLRTAALIEAVLKEAMGEAPGMDQEGKDAPGGEHGEDELPMLGLPFNIPFPRNTNFLGREAALHQLHVALNSTAPTRPALVRIDGGGGYGKTQLALEFAYRQFDNAAYDGFLWVDASANLAHNFIALALHVNAPVDGSMSEQQQITSIVKVLEGTSKWLIIFDGLSQNQVEDMQLMIPQKGTSHVIVTSREDLKGFTKMDLPLMTTSEAIQILTGTTGREAEMLLTVGQTRLLNELKGLPIALAIASRLLAGGHFTVDGLLARITGEGAHSGDQRLCLRELFEASLESLVAAQPLPPVIPPHPAEDSIPEDSIPEGGEGENGGEGESKAEGAEESPKAQAGDLAVAMFEVASFFGPYTIPFPILVIAAKLRLGLEGDEDAEAAVEKLEYLSLLQRDTDGDVFIHRMLQGYGRSRAMKVAALAAVSETLSGAKCMWKTLPHFIHNWENMEVYKNLTFGNHVALPSFLETGLSLASFHFEKKRNEEALAVCNHLLLHEDKLEDKTFFWKLKLLMVVHLQRAQDYAALQDWDESQLNTLPTTEKRLIVYSIKVQLALQKLAKDPMDTEWCQFALQERFHRLDTEGALDSFTDNQSPYGLYQGMDFSSMMAAKAVQRLGHSAASRVQDAMAALEYHERVVALYQRVHGIWGGAFLADACTSAVASARHLDLTTWLQQILKDLFVRMKSGQGQAHHAAKGVRTFASIRLHSDERVDRETLLQVALDAIGLEPVTNKVEFAFVLSELGRIRLKHDGPMMLEQARTILEETLPDLESICGEDSPQALRAAQYLGYIFRLLEHGGDPDLSKAFLTRTANAKPELHPQDEGTLRKLSQDSCLELAQVHMEEKDWDAAESALKTVLHSREVDSGLDDPDTIEIHDHLAAVYWLKEHPDLTKKSLSKSIYILEKMMAPNKTRIDVHKSYLANIYTPGVI